MRVDTRPRRKNAPRIAEKSAPGFLQWVRGRNCLACPGQTPVCNGKVEAAHVDYAGDKGVGTKVSDRFAVPLCNFHHSEQHRLGWQEFERRFGFSGIDAAAYLWKHWPGRIAWERKLSDG
jgi:hypothetical protein